MAKKKALTGADIDKALAEIAAEQKAWFAARHHRKVKEARAAAARQAARLATICRIGKYLDRQRRVC